MNEQDDMPRLDGLRHDDPPFREHFSTQPDKTPEQLMEQRRKAHNAYAVAQMKPDKKPVHKKPMPIIDEHPEIVDMHDAADVISTILRVSKGGKYVSVDKLIEALR